MLNTDAESVDDMAAANKKHPSTPKGSAWGILMDRSQMKPPVNATVSVTPSVDKTTPCRNTGLMLRYSVSMPPASKITVRAMLPTDCAMSKLSNLMPTPSWPKAMPTAKNKSSEGTPNL